MRISDWSSDVCSSDLGVHRCDAPTLSSGRDWQPEGRFLAALGQRRLLVTMNHIATSQPPCREPPETVLMGQDHRTLVLHPPNAVVTSLCTDPRPPLKPRHDHPYPHRSEARTVGKACGSTCRSRWTPYQ